MGSPTSTWTRESIGAADGLLDALDRGADGDDRRFETGASEHAVTAASMARTARQTARLRSLRTTI
jgi:hypothetical protein